MVKERLLDRYRKAVISRDIPPLPAGAVVALDDADDVLLLCSGYLPRIHFQTYAQEVAFAQALAARDRRFAVTDDPARIFEKQVAWFLPGPFVAPRLWDYSRQVYEVACGLERQDNRLFCSSDETRYWENKAYMHRRLAEVGAPTPRTVVVNRDNVSETRFDLEPVLLKEEHSASSAGVHHFTTAEAARAFCVRYRFRPGESLIMQQVVPGATRDLRLTLVGERTIESATYWRIKSADALARPDWTPTATAYESLVAHGDIPDNAVATGRLYMRRLGVRAAGIDLIWIDDDVSRDPLILEFSPYFQPNPPKPVRYAEWTYKRYKQRAYVKEGYLFGQYDVFREIAQQLLDQELF